MKRHFPGLHTEASWRWSSGRCVPGSGRSPTIVGTRNPSSFSARELSSKARSRFTQKPRTTLTAPRGRLNRNWFLRLRLRPRLAGQDEVQDEKHCSVFTGVPRTTRKSFAGRTFVNLEGFAPSTEWEFISKSSRRVVAGGSTASRRLASACNARGSIAISVPTAGGKRKIGPR